jgi:TRAP-type mannitol/chloroaromatic compound transport system substrate-binding protein
MKRRKFLSGSAVAGAVAATAAVSSFPTPAISQGRKQWTAVSAFGKAGILGRQLQGMADFIGKATDGRLTIKVFHAGELVGAFEAFDAVQDGTAQMGLGAPYYWTGKSKAIQFIAAMPFGLNAQEQNAWFYYGGGIEAADKIYNELGTKFLPCGNTGNQMGGWYREEVNSISDFNGLKFRMPGLGGEVLRTFGTNVVLLPGGEILPALAAGAIDGTEWIGPAADLGKGLYKVCKYYYYPGWHEPATVLDLFLNLKEWESLDAELKDVVMRGAASTNVAMLSEFQARNNAALQKLINEHGVQLRKYSDEILNAIGQRSGEVLEKIAAEDPLSKSTFDEIVKFRRTAVTWANYSEGAFIKARSLPFKYPG